MSASVFAATSTLPAANAAPAAPVAATSAKNCGRWALIAMAPMPNTHWFPNPVQDVLNVSFKMPMAGTAYVQLVDAIGRVVRDRDMDLERGQQTISIRTGGLSAGSYRMRLFTNSTGVPQTAQFVKE